MRLVLIAIREHGTLKAILYSHPQLFGEKPTNVYRVDGKGGPPSVVAGDLNRPNGLCFSPDESKLYIVEGGVTPRLIHAYDVVDGGTRLANKRPLINAGPGTPDGTRCDVGAQRNRLFMYGSTAMYSLYVNTQGTAGGEFRVSTEGRGLAASAVWNGSSHADVVRSGLAAWTLRPPPSRMESTMMARADCAICRQPLPTSGPVAYVDKQRLIHIRCYRPVVPPRRDPRRSLHPRTRRARTV